MSNRVKRVILWLPGVILVAACIVVTLILVTSNTNRIKRLEDTANTPVITFTFTQQIKPDVIQRFRIICNANKNSANIYVCTTIAGAPTPGNLTPSPSPTQN